MFSHTCVYWELLSPYRSGDTEPKPLSFPSIADHNTKFDVVSEHYTVGQ